MKFTRFAQSSANTIQLQSIGHVLGTPAGEIKKGDTLMWNFGTTSVVSEILKQTEKTIVIAESYDGKIYERKLSKKRLVCILQN